MPLFMTSVRARSSQIEDMWEALSKIKLNLGFARKINKVKSNEIKKNALPAYIWASNGIRQSDVTELFGVLPVDIDNHCNNEDFDPAFIKAELFKSPYVISAWLSSSRNGVHGLVRVDALKDIKEHFNHHVKEATAQMIALLEAENPLLHFDRKVNSSEKKLFVSQDFDILIRKDAVSFPYERVEVTEKAIKDEKEKKRKEKRISSSSEYLIPQTPYQLAVAYQAFQPLKFFSLQDAVFRNNKFSLMTLMARAKYNFKKAVPGERRELRHELARKLSPYIIGMDAVERYNLLGTAIHWVKTNSDHPDDAVHNFLTLLEEHISDKTPIIAGLASAYSWDLNIENILAGFQYCEGSKIRRQDFYAWSKSVGLELSSHNNPSIRDQVVFLINQRVAELTKKAISDKVSGFKNVSFTPPDHIQLEFSPGSKWSLGGFNDNFKNWLKVQYEANSIDHKSMASELHELFMEETRRGISTLPQREAIYSSVMHIFENSVSIPLSDMQRVSVRVFDPIEVEKDLRIIKKIKHMKFKDFNLKKKDRPKSPPASDKVDIKKKKSVNLPLISDTTIPEQIITGGDSIFNLAKGGQAPFATDSADFFSWIDSQIRSLSQSASSSLSLLLNPLTYRIGNLAIPDKVLVSKQSQWYDGAYPFVYQVNTLKRDVGIRAWNAIRRFMKKEPEYEDLDGKLLEFVEKFTRKVGALYGMRIYWKDLDQILHYCMFGLEVEDEGYRIWKLKKEKEQKERIFAKNKRDKQIRNALKWRDLIACQT